jgi:hypothetical protein
MDIGNISYKTCPASASLELFWSNEAPKNQAVQPRQMIDNDLGYFYYDIMSLILYFARAFALLRCCVSSSYRALTLERWKRTPQHRVALEVGTGIIGLVAAGAIIAVIVISITK